jgi:hypothetical protein
MYWNVIKLYLYNWILVINLIQILIENLITIMERRALLFTMAWYV